MRIVLYADAIPESQPGITPAHAVAQIILDTDNDGTPIKWADVITAREHLRNLIGEVLAELQTDGSTARR
jgi:hypothetical protein